MTKDRFTYRCGLTLRDLIIMGQGVCLTCPDTVPCGKEYAAHVFGSKRVGNRCKQRKDCNQEATRVDAGATLQVGHGVSYGVEAGQ